MADLRFGLRRFGRNREAVIDALVIDGGADPIAGAVKRGGHRQIALRLRERRVMLAQNIHGCLVCAVLPIRAAARSTARPASGEGGVCFHTGSSVFRTAA